MPSSSQDNDHNSPKNANTTEPMTPMDHSMHMDHTEHNQPMAAMDHHMQMHHAGHNQAMAPMDHSMHMGNFKQRFFISLLISLPIILLSPMMGVRLPFQISFPGSDWLVFFLAGILFLYGGKPFLDGAKIELQQRSPAMMTLISLGISVSYFYSAYGFIANKFFANSGHLMNFFWELASLIVIMLLGHWIEMNAINQAGNALQKMAALLPAQAQVINADGSIVTVPLEQVQTNDRLIVSAGATIPTDGIVVAGETTVNEAMVTGEAKAVSKTIGDQLIGGSINGAGALTVQVTATGQAGYLAQVMRLVEQAQKDKSKIETLSDKVAKILFYVALVAGIGAYIAWLLVTKDNALALERMVTVFIIACPHALGLAIPLVIARSTSLAASHGLLIRNRNALEQARQIDSILMDKTGTLTEGNFAVTLVQSFDPQISQQQILAWLAALENYSNHPLAVGILAAAKAQNLTIAAATNVQINSGIGLTGTIAGSNYAIVSAAYLDKHQLSYPEQSYQQAAANGYSVSFLLREQQVLAMVALGDTIKPNAKEFIQQLSQAQINAVMLTGDNLPAATAVAAQLGLTQFHAALLPQQKEQIVQQYQQNQHKVMMVGDGINDAPSLARADIGVAIGAGTDVAIDAADVILVKSDPADILVFLTLAKRTMRKMVENIWWGAGYNIVAIPLAAGVLAPLGIVLSPAVGAVLMSLSTIIVALNAMSLTLKK